MTITISIITILTSFFLAAREIINLDRNTDSKFYTWDTGIWNFDAFHTYPFIGIIGLVSVPVMLLEYATAWIGTPLFLFVMYQFRNLFMHKVLPFKIFDEMTPIQSIGFGVSVFITILFIINYEVFNVLGR